MSSASFPYSCSTGLLKSGLEVSLVVERTVQVRDEIMGKLPIASETSFVVYISLPRCHASRSMLLLS